LISDSVGIQSFYRKVFWRETCMIPYGAPSLPEVSSQKQAEILAAYGLEAGRYFLQITRLEPDNLPLPIAESFHQSGLGQTGFKFVIVGYKEATPYAERLKKFSQETGIQLLPANYDQEVLYTLRKNCFGYLHGNSVGGTNPALLEAMSACPRILALDIVFSREVLGETGHYFSLANLSQVFQESLAFPEASQSLQMRLRKTYQWEAVAASYLALVENRVPTYLPQTAGSKELT